MKDYGIIGDSLDFRQEVFKTLMTPIDGYVDGAMDYCLLKYFLENKSDDEKLLGCFLFGLTYSSTTSLIFWSKYKTLENVTDIEDFYNKVKDQLYFSKDRRRVKYFNQFIPAFKKIKELSTGSFKNYIFNILNKENGDILLLKEITSHWSSFGSFSGFLFFDAFSSLFNKKFTNIEIDWNNKNASRTLIPGIRILLGQDDVSNIHMATQEDIEVFNNYIIEISKEQIWAINDIESALCFYYKIFKKTRYFGYYDRMLEECYLMDDLLKEHGLDIWEARKKVIPAKFRGELDNRWSGVRKNRMDRFLLTGEL